METIKRQAGTVLVLVWRYTSVICLCLRLRIALVTVGGLICLVVKVYLAETQLLDDMYDFSSDKLPIYLHSYLLLPFCLRTCTG